MVDEAADGLGGLDVLVNNAGVFDAAPDHRDDATRSGSGPGSDTLGVNLVGAANVTWCAVQHMLAAGGGRIVNVASRGAFRGEPDAPAYGASKAGLIAFGQSLARALGPHGIAVIVRRARASPRPTWPPRSSRASAATRGAPRARSAASRPPEEVAAAVLFLASPEAEFASGTVLDVNGASYLRM